MSESTMSTTTLTTERRDDVLVIWIDVPGESVNTVGPSMVG